MLRGVAASGTENIADVVDRLIAADAEAVVLWYEDELVSLRMQLALVDVHLPDGLVGWSDRYRSMVKHSAIDKGVQWWRGARSYFIVQPTSPLVHVVDGVRFQFRQVFCYDRDYRVHWVETGWPRKLDTCYRQTPKEMAPTTG